VASVLDVGHAQGDPYVVMDLPEGVSLRTVMDARQPRDLGFRVDLISQLCDALADAHAHGVTQLGIRPTGIFVGAEGHVTVVPFGVIPIHGSRGTLAALSLDEIAYLAPELVEGHVADRRADVFSLGVIAFELMARRRPFRASNIPALLRALVSDRPAFEPSERAQLAPGLEALILKALAREPADRYSDAGVMLVELSDLACSAPARLALDAAESRGSRDAPEAGEGMAGVEGLRAAALSCVAEGQFETAEALAARIEGEAPGDPRNGLLRAYLHEERAVEVLLATARQQMAAGRLREARAAVIEALGLDPWRAAARALLRYLDRTLFRAKERSTPAVSGRA